GRGQHVANHRADGRATVRKHRLPGGTHRDSAVSAGAVKVGVLGVLATATIAAPLAAAASGIDEAAPQGETSAQAAPAASAAEAQAPAPVALPSTETAEAAVETPEGTGIEVSVPEPVEVAEVADPVGHDGYLRPVSGPITSGYGGRMHPVLGYFKGHDGVDFGAACGTPVHAAKSGTVVA